MVQEAKILNLKQCINRNVEALMPQDDQKELFKQALTDFIDKANEGNHESEEFQKGLFRDFLRKVIPNKLINTSERIDLAIYNGESSKSKVGVLFEYKKIDNQSEMMSLDKLNVKSFQELVSYYLRERIINHNLEVKKGIVTNGRDFFVIDSKELEKHFIKNKKLVSNFKKFENRQLSSSTTDFLFNEVVAPEIDKAINKHIRIGHFRIANNHLSELALTRLYRFFTADNLLNELLFLDSNKLNKGFYNELLYIMGLHEEKHGSNKLITRLKPAARQSNSLVENAIDQIKMKGIDVEDPFDIAVQLNVVWVNRILFLKLLESSLVSFNKDNNYKFLSYEKIPTFDDLNELFFGVMARKINERDPRVIQKYPHVPYMNSSLFEQTELELSREGFPISELREGEIEVFSKTKLKGNDGKKLKGKLPVLEYLFRFLSSYDFTSAPDAKDKKSKDQLINASVLGLIFEKINGYKDGSFFTPGKITMYMAKRAIRQAVVTKVNDVLGTSAKSIIELGTITRDFSFSLEKRKQVSDAINSLKILDPAVGSGHFLVSILNEIIAIKSSLRVLFDADGKLLNEISCTVANDELVIQNFDGSNYSYDANNLQSLRIQEAIFEQKKVIIENCLYGVDINSNSVNICRLRLWIELLKNAYYSTDTNGDRYLTTLPNIDINIKIGDSLIHRFTLDDKFDLRRSDFKEYLDLVREYKNTSDKKVKARLNKSIDEIKQRFLATFKTPEAETYAKAKAKLTKAGQVDLFQKTDMTRFLELEQKAEQAKQAYEQRKKDPMYFHSLEWRLEFPEVLDEDGNFVGFDVVIANPPYIFARNQSFDEKTKRYYLTHYQVDEYQANTYTLFMELGYKLLKKNGTFAYIVPNNMLTIQSNQKIRNFLLDNSGNLVIINSLDKLFADANVDNCLVFLKKNKSDKVTVGELNNGDFETVGTVNKSFFGNQNPIFSISMVKYRDTASAYWKINKSKPISSYCSVKTGIKAYQVGKGKSKLYPGKKMTAEDRDGRVYHSKIKEGDMYLPYINGDNVKRYYLSPSDEFIYYGEWLAEPRKSTNFSEPRILVRQIPSKSSYAIDAVYVDTTVINDINSMVIEDINGIDIFALLGIINSKPITLWFLIKYDKFQRRLFPQFKNYELASFPAPNINKQTQAKIKELVIRIMDKIKNDRDVSKENKEIDELVMDAFNLNEEEKQSVRDFTF